MEGLNDFLVEPNVTIDPSRLTPFVQYIKDNDLHNDVIKQEHYTDFLKKFVDVRGEISISKPEVNIEIVKTFSEVPKKKSITDWVKYYNNKFEKIRDLIINTRPEMDKAVSINNLKNKSNNEKIFVIGMISSINTTKFGTKIIMLEDPTGAVKCTLKNLKGEYLDELVNDEVIGVIGTKYNESIFIERIIFPDIPDKNIKKTNDDVYSCYTSDIHIGSRMFLEDKFQGFIRWLKGEDEDPALNKIAQKVKYIFVMGDNVDGVGVFPNQKKRLVIESIYAQYNKLAEHLKQIPKDKQIIMIPGDHDATRLAEPQTKIPKEFLGDLNSLDNIHFLSNPSTVRIHKTDNFEGYTNLIYHGNSIIPYIQDIPSLRSKGMEKADWALHFLLRKRHLAPSHALSRISPSPNDHLFIDHVPDIFAIGHVHFCDLSRYKQTITITSSCWQDKTERQEELGLNPHPAIVPVFSLKENKMFKIRFDGEKNV